MSDFKLQVQRVISDMLPYIKSHNGDIELLSCDESTGEVDVKLLGACVDCPISHITLKHGLEDEMNKRVEGFKKLVNKTDG